MPLVAHSNLPAFDRLRAEGHEVLPPHRATAQDIRELHIGLLNMMPDAALEATERQFLRLIGACNRIAQFHVHPFTVAGIEREGGAKVHVDSHYERFDEIKRLGLDALVITGANPADPDITREGFWSGLVEVLTWARENVCSTVCSCLATHAVLKEYHALERVRLPQKRWGVYSHRVVGESHPLLTHINTRFDAPHSHVYEVTREQVEAAGMRVLAQSAEAGVHLAVTHDGFRLVMFQGHPEYDRHSLLKEYRREVDRYLSRERDDYPPFPDHYFPAAAVERLEAYRHAVGSAQSSQASPPPFPESETAAEVDNTWSDTGKAMFNNWLGLVYQITHRERHLPFMDGIDPNNPLGLDGCE